MIDRTVSRTDVQRVANRLGNVFFGGLHGFQCFETFCQLGGDTGRECTARTVRMRRREAAVGPLSPSYPLYEPSSSPAAIDPHVILIHHDDHKPSGCIDIVQA